jgi:hypothetical protein
MLHSLPHHTILHHAAQSRTCGRFRTKELGQATLLRQQWILFGTYAAKFFFTLSVYGYHSAH